MPHSCVVKSCWSNLNRRLIRFPKDPEQQLKWIDILKIPQLLKLTPQDVLKKMRVCDKHFRNEDIIPYNNNDHAARSGSLPVIADIPTEIVSLSPSSQEVSKPNAYQRGLVIHKEAFSRENAEKQVHFKKKRRRYCVVLNCDGVHAIQHSLPKNDTIRKKWLELLNREDLINRNFSELRNFRVCGSHFHQSSYRNPESIGLNRGALPIKQVSTPEEVKNVSKLRVDKCIVTGCDLNVKPSHRLPISKELRDKWLNNLDRNDLKDIPFTSLKRKIVCGAHFEQSQYFNENSTRLLRNQLPRPIKPLETVDIDETINNTEIDEIQDEVIATGEVTAPLLCHNKVLLKTRSTYSKNKYKMTYEEDEKSPEIIEPKKRKKMSTTSISTSTKKQNKAAQEPQSFITLDEDEDVFEESECNDDPISLTESDYIKEGLSITEELDKYDNKLFSIMEEIKSLPNFLDVIFGFLYRRTDYFQISSDPNEKIGLPKGVAQKLLQQSFQKYEEKTPITEEHVDKDKDKDKNDVHYNGGVFKNYAWSQSISDLDIQIKIPDKITCKQLQIDTTSSNILIKLKNSETVYLKGDLCKRCKMNETVWSLGGHILQIHLEKAAESWWDCLLQTEPRLDFNKMEHSRRPFHELSHEFKQLISSEINSENDVLS